MTDATEPARPPPFVAPMDAERMRFLLKHLPQLTGVEQPLTGEIKQLGEAGLLWLVGGKLELTAAGRKLLETL